MTSYVDSFTSKGEYSSAKSIGLVKDTDISDIIVGRKKQSNYYFSGYMPEIVLHRYLDKSLLTQLLSDDWKPDGADHPGPDPTTHSMLLQMILNVGAKYVWDLLFTNIWNDLYNNLKNDVNYLHSHDSEIICGASIGEFCLNDYQGYLLPLTVSGAVDTAVVDMFYKNGLNPSYKGGRPASWGGNFNIHAMRLDNSSYIDTNEWQAGAYFDITLPEAQLFYYYIATKFIDCGCEAIHLGDIFLTAKKDTGKRYLWYVMSKIREYARVNARRGVVLLDTHTTNNKNWTDSPGGWFYDPTDTVLPEWERQLIFDFHSLGVDLSRNFTKSCDDDVFGKNNWPSLLESKADLLGKSKGGKHPQGWYCVHNPILLRFDSGGNYNYSPGCNNPDW